MPLVDTHGTRKGCPYTCTLRKDFDIALSRSSISLAHPYHWWYYGPCLAIRLGPLSRRDGGLSSSHRTQSPVLSTHFVAPRRKEVLYRATRTLPQRMLYACLLIGSIMPGPTNLGFGMTQTLNQQNHMRRCHK
jgi:hypothetical protein